MRLLVKKIKLFFTSPKELFLQLKESPDLKSAAILFLIEVGTLSLHDIKLVTAKHTGIASLLFALVLSTIFMFAVASVGLLLASFYTLLFCRVFRSRPKFSTLLSSMIYCGIPIIIFNMLYALFPFKTDLQRVIAVDTLHPFLNEVLRSIEPFRLWMAAMEIIALSIIAELSYLKSFIVVFSYWVVGIILIYSFGVKLSVY